jgi:uncharacterized protein
VSDLAQLLAVQDHDTAADQLRHRLQNLPQRAELAAVQRELDELEAATATTATRRDELARSQRRLEDEIDALEAKSASVDRTLYSGTVNVPRELTAMQEELEALRRRRSRLEDDVLEIMEEREPLDAALEKATARRIELTTRYDELGASLAQAEATVQAALAEETARRDEAAAAVPPPLMAEYERLRTRMGGVAAAPLQGRSCGGCHLALSAVEIDRLRRLPLDAVVHCEECGRILVR